MADPFAEFPEVEAPGVTGEPPAPGSSFDEFPEVGATAGEKAAAFGKGVTGGVVRTGPIVAGMAAGAKLGTLGGPYAPVTVPLGAAGGALAGYMFGETVAGAVDLPTPEEMPEDVRPYGYAGEVVGAGAVPAGAPLAAAKGTLAPLRAATTSWKLPASTVGNYINRIIDTAGRTPGTFAASEAAGLASAATAGGVAEAYAPGETGTRIAAEVGAGFFNPSRLLLSASRRGVDAVQQAVSSFSPGAREGRAARILQDIVREAGEDPDALAEALRTPAIKDLVQTSAQKVGSPALAAVEAKLANQSAKFGAEARATAEKSFETLRNAVVALRGTGDPQALRLAAELQKTRFRALLSGRLQMAEREAVEAAAKITDDTPEARAALSKVASDSVRGALKDARSIEKELWAAVPRNVPTTGGNIIKRHSEIRDQLLKEESISKIASGFVKRLKKNKGDTTAGDLMRYRSRMLANARESAAQNKGNDARIFGELAEAALDDLDAMFGGPTEGIMRTFGVKQEAYEAARTFSRELNDTFTRTFAGKSMAKEATGAARRPPELLMREAMGAGAEGAALRFRELEEATRFLPARGLDGPNAGRHFDVMVDAQERLVRLASSEAIDANTGRINPGRLANVIRKNSELMGRFPSVRRDLQGALTSEIKRRDLERLTKNVSRAADQKEAFSRVIRYENPADAVKAAVSTGNRNPITEIEGMVKVARKGGKDAVQGLKAAIWEHGARQATTAGGDFSFERLRQTLFNPIRPGQPSLISIMRREGLMKPRDVARADKLLKEAEKMLSVLKSGTDLEKLVGEPDPLMDLVIRVAGARFGAAIAQGGGSGSSLIAAGRGSETFRKLFEQVPKAKTRDLLMEAMRDPKFAAMLLEKPTTRGRAFRLANQIHSYLWQAGLTGSESAAEESAPALPASQPARHIQSVQTAP